MSNTKSSQNTLNGQQQGSSNPYYGSVANNSNQTSSRHTLAIPYQQHVYSQSQQIPIRVNSMPAPNLHQVSAGLESMHSSEPLWADHHQLANISNESHNSSSDQFTSFQIHNKQANMSIPSSLAISKYSPIKLSISTNSSSAMQSLESSAMPHAREMGEPPYSLVVPPPTVATAATLATKKKQDTVADLPTPSSTPITSRKIRRRSNLFIPSSKKLDDKTNKNDEVGSGRAIPLKQGYLYKRSIKSLNKEWKKKYVTLCDDGRLTYHPSLHDYMDDVHGKEIQLQMVTVKVPGQKPRGSKSIITNSILNKKASNDLSVCVGGLTLERGDNKVTEKVLLNAFETLREPMKNYSQTSGDEGIVLSNSNSQTYLNIEHQQLQQPPYTKNVIDAQTPNVKKRHRRMKSSGLKNNEYDGKFRWIALERKRARRQ